MKNILIVCITCLLCASALASGDPDYIRLDFSSVSTNASAITADIHTSGRQTGYFDGFHLDLAGYASPTVDVDIVTVATNGSTLISRTLWTKDSVTADTEKIVRSPVVNTTDTAISNEGATIPLVSDKIQVSIYNANVTNTISGSIILYLIK